VRTLLRLVALTLVLLGSTTTAASAQAPEGRIVDFAIEPPQVALTAGDAVTWTNTGNRPHTITDRGGLFDTGAILPGAQASVPLDVPGTYAIFCEINPSRMNATLVVEPGDEPPTEVRVQALDEAREGETKRFDPPELEVATGTRLILANVGGQRHSLVAEDGSFKTTIAEPGPGQGRFSGTFVSVVVEEPGTFPFFCEIHPAVMQGTLTVTDDEVQADDRAPPEAEPPDDTATASAVDFAFLRPSTTVAAGGSVTWSNDGEKPHTATFDDVELDTGTIEPGAQATLTAPEQPGTYSYFCTIHPTQMRGVLVVPPDVAAADDGADDGEVAAPPPAVDEETDGTALAYVIAVLVIGVGVIGLFFGLRQRPA
jgi:plastocyanin